MIINNKRALAYTAIIHDIKDIPGADNIQLGYVNAWSIIIKKNEFKEGDKVVFFEIDSLVPADNPVFSFLQKTNYKIKTYRLNKFKVVSQGLVLPLSDFPEIDPATPIETDVTELLKIKYYVRYMDDFVLFHEDCEYLKYCKKEIERELKKVKLRLNDKTCIAKVTSGFVFLGYRFLFKNNKIYMLPSKQMKKKIRKRYKKEGTIIIN